MNDYDINRLFIGIGNNLKKIICVVSMAERQDHFNDAVGGELVKILFIFNEIPKVLNKIPRIFDRLPH